MVFDYWSYMATGSIKSMYIYPSNKRYMSFSLSASQHHNPTLAYIIKYLQTNREKMKIKIAARFSQGYDEITMSIPGTWDNAPEIISIVVGQ